MADISIGDITARLRLDTSGLQQGLQQAQAALQGLQQSTQRITGAQGQMAQGLQQTTQATSANTQATTAAIQAQRQSAQATQQTTQALQTMQAAQQAATQATQQATQAHAAWHTALAAAAGLGIATSIQAIASALSNVVGESVRASMTAENLVRAFRAIEGSSAAAQRTMTTLFTTAQRIGVDFTTLAGSFKNFEAASQGTTLAGDGIRQVFEQINRGAVTLGLTSQQLGLTITALSQILSKGRLSAEELNQQLAEHVPMARAGIAQNLGITTQALTRMTEAGLIPATTAVLAFAESQNRLSQGGQAQTIDTLAQAYARLKNETTAWMTALGDGINQIILPFIRYLTTLSEKARELFNIKPPGASGGARSRWDEPVPPLSVAGELANLNPFVMTQRWGKLQERQIKASADIEALIGFWSTYRGLDPNLVRAMAQRESGLDPTQRGPVITKGPLAGDRAYGLMQIMGTTGAGYGKTVDELMNASTSLDLGTRHLTTDIKRITDVFGDLEDVVPLALAAYNAGIANVRRGLESLKAQNKPLTWENFAALGKDVGLPQPEQTIPYVRNIMRMREQFQSGERAIPGGGTAQAQAATPATQQAAQATQGITAAAGNLSETILKDLVANIERTLQELPQIEKEFDNVAASGLNINGILDKALRQQADRAVESFGRVSGLLAQVPGLLERLTPPQQEQLRLASQQVALFQQRVDALLKSPELDLLKQQVDEMERLTIKRQADILAQQRGREEAEKFQRTEEAALALRQIDERRRMALLPLDQQLAGYRQQLDRLRTDADLLGTEVERQHAQQLLPQVQTRLSSIETLLGAPGRSAPEQAREAVRQQGEEARKGLMDLVRQLTQEPMLAQIAPKLVDRIEAAFAQIPTFVEQQGQKAFDTLDQQMRDRIQKIGNTIDQIGDRMGLAGLSPLQRAVAEVGQQFDAMRDKLLEEREALEQYRKTVTDTRKGEIDAELEALDAYLSRFAQARATAMRTRQELPGREFLTGLAGRLEQLQTPREESPFVEGREQIKLRQAAAQAEMTDAQREQTAVLLDQIQAQRELNYWVGLYEQAAGAVGSAWTNALMSIAERTKSVGEAFKEMARNILMSLAQIAAQQAFGLLIGMGSRALMGTGPGGNYGGMSQGLNTQALPYDYGFQGGQEGSGEGMGGAQTALGAVANIAGIIGMFAQHGGVVNRPTLALIGENPANNPEVVLNRHQMQGMLQARDGGGGVSVHNHPSKESAERGAAQDRAAGRTAIVNEVLSDLNRGESSRIQQVLRKTAR